VTLETFLPGITGFEGSGVLWMVAIVVLYFEMKSAVFCPHVDSRVSLRS
jgi:hypothetical protein